MCYCELYPLDNLILVLHSYGSVVLSAMGFALILMAFLSQLVIAFPSDCALFSMIILGWALIVYSNSALPSNYLILGYNRIGYLLCEYSTRTLLFCFCAGIWSHGYA